MQHEKYEERYTKAIIQNSEKFSTSTKIIRNFTIRTTDEKTPIPQIILVYLILANEIRSLVNLAFDHSLFSANWCKLLDTRLVSFLALVKIGKIKKFQWNTANITIYFFF